MFLYSRLLFPLSGFVYVHRAESCTAGQGRVNAPGWKQSFLMGAPV